jgi:hypothetical protein
MLLWYKRFRLDGCGNRLTAMPSNADCRKERADFTLRICAPLYWHDRTLPFPKELRGGSCFFLRFGAGLVGVTANHVLEIYRAKLKQTPNVVCQLRLMPFALNDAVIDSDDELDIATFGVSEDELTQIQGTALDCRRQWPPPHPERMGAVSLAGFPEVIREINPTDRSAQFRAYGALSAIEDFSEREILVTCDPSRDQPLIRDVDPPPSGFNMSGCSGGPALMQGERNGLHRWFPVGIIVKGSRSDATGEARTFDYIRVRRIHFIQEDGHIHHSEIGWLPLRPFIDPRY